MMEILFRGKQTLNGDWVEGNLFIPYKHDTPTQILIGTDIYRISYDVIPETVGQFTGFTDKNGKRIFEGDIIRKTNQGRHPKIFTANIRTNFRVKEEVYYSPFEHFTESCEYEIIGNIHDNPDLLLESKEEK